jgi:hypothetical protein
MTHYQRWRRTGTTEDPAPPMNTVPCSVDGCDRLGQSRGFCNLHVQRYLRHGDPTITARDLALPCGTEGCSNLRRPTATSGLCARCVDRKYRAAWIRRHGHTARLLREYGLTEAEYQAMLEEQSGVCAICRRPESARTSSGEIRRLAVDHDHETGAVRGLLCGACNRGIGLLGDDADRLASAAAYLAVHRQVAT